MSERKTSLPLDQASAPAGPTSDPTSLGLQWQLALAGLGFGAAAVSLAALSLGVKPLVVVSPAAAAAAAGAVLGFWLGRPVKRDLREIGLYATALARGQFGSRLPDGGMGEFRHLKLQLNRTAKALAEQVDALRRLSDERADLLERSERLAVVEERQRLARELHDTVSQELFALAMSVAAARSSLPEDLGPERERLQRAEEGARRAQVTMRNLIRALRPVELGEQRLGPAIGDLLREAEERRGVDVRLDIDEALDLPTGIEDAIFRIAQEALANALRHGGATRVQARLGRAGQRVLFSLRDNGRGFDLQAVREGYGIRGMRERAAEVGGRVDVSPSPGEGCTVSFWLDLEGGEGN